MPHEVQADSPEICDSEAKVVVEDEDTASFQSSISSNSIAYKDNDKDLKQRSSQTPLNQKMYQSLQSSATGSYLKEETNIDNKQDNKKPRVSELDKFKRRLIRTVARLLLKEKKPEEEVWQELQKETSCDCKLLWTRMSALTIKKLKRLFIANDELDKITNIAQLSVTDWMLFDLLLVHEDVDVIGQDIQTNNKSDPKILEELFALVMKYKIESLRGDGLTAAWYDLTAEYNSRGRKCSPMLLQRRWYQMKDLVRYNFYNFWFTYRGSQNNLESADKFKPTYLQMEIVDKYMSIVTQPFKRWEDLINEKRVSLYSDFERLLQAKKRSSQSENEPDIEVIEPLVETIDVDSDDDSLDEDSRYSASVSNNDENSNPDVIESKSTASINESINTVNIKNESIYDLCDEDEVSELVHTQPEDNRIENISERNYEIINKQNPVVIHETSGENESITVSEKTNMQESSTQEKSDYICEGIIEDLNCEKDNSIASTKTKTPKPNITAKTSIEIPIPQISNITSAAQIPEIPVEDDVPEEINAILEKVSDNITNNRHDIDIHSNRNMKDIIDITVEKNSEPVQNLYSDVLTNDLNFIEGIELEDDGIIYVDEDEDVRDVNTKVKIEEESIKQAEDTETATFDLKLLLDPVVYTKKLDDMDVFRFIDFIAVKDTRVIKTAAIESKPIDKKSVNMKDITEERRKSKEIDSLSESEVSESDEDHIVSPTSWLFRKLSFPTYNPIQLCKNPDFNTRLKRLTAGFFSSERNRLLLKNCKPLTIDLHKKFESKLVNNILYLKKKCNSVETSTTEFIKTTDKNIILELPDQNVKSEKQIKETLPISESPSPVMIDKIITKEVHTDRNKVISLPDFDQIRRTNEKLLVAEVTPIQVLNLTPKPQITLVKSNDNKIEIEVPPIEKDVVVHVDTFNNAPTDTILTSPCIEKVNEANSVKLNSYLRKKKRRQEEKEERKKHGKPLIKYTLNNHRPVNVTWVPRGVPKVDELPTDRCLAPDTVKRIINVSKGILGDGSKKKKEKKRLSYVEKVAKNNLKSKDQPVSKKLTHHDCSEKAARSKPISIDVETEPTSKKLTHLDSQENIVNNKPLSIDEDTEPASKKLTQLDCSEIIARCNPTSVDVDTELNKIIINLDRKKARRSNTSCCWARHKLDYWDSKIKRLKMTHTCPQAKCQCCCSMEYCSRLLELSRYQDIPCPEVKYTPIKVSIGVNTYFNKDFEEYYANNMALNDNIVNSVEKPSVTFSLGSNTKYNNNSTQTTITFHNNIFEPVCIPPKINIKFGTEPHGPLISEVRSVTTSEMGNSSLSTNKINKSKPECKITVYSGLPNSNTQEPQNIDKRKSLLNNIILEKKIEIKDNTNNKVIQLNNGEKINTIKSPICLGDNKILLYTTKPVNEKNTVDFKNIVGDYQNQNLNKEPIAIPDGVHLSLLPNQELVLSIDPRVQLDPVQIANLPNTIAAVQQQLVAIGAVQNEPTTKTSTPKFDDVIQLSDDEKTSENMNNELSVNSKEINESDTRNRNSENNVSFIEVSQSEYAHCVNTHEELITNIENKSVNIETIPDPETSSSMDNLLVDIHNDIVASNVEIDDTTTNSTDSINVVDTSKKTILTDLMEMSGISMEDTTISTTESQIIPPTVQVANDNNTPSTNVKMSSSLLGNPFVHSALLKCQDLNVVTSFDELRNVYTNGGQFYKMDTDNGIIVPINVCIKKQVRKKKSRTLAMTKAFIDLTEDDENKNESQISDTDTSNARSFVLENIGPKHVKPIKLFKAVHPSLLKKPNILRRISLLKRQLPQDKIISKMDDKVTVANSESDDDEPLALTAKRKKNKVVESKNIEPVDKNDGQDDEILDTVEPNFNAITSDQSLLPDSEIDVQIKRVEPVFLNNEDSMDEDCILGV